MKSVGIGIIVLAFLAFVLCIEALVFMLAWNVGVRSLADVKELTFWPAIAFALVIAVILSGLRSVFAKETSK